MITFEYDYQKMIHIELEFEVLDYEPLIQIEFNGKTLYKGVAEKYYSFQAPAIRGLKVFDNEIKISRYGKDYRRHQLGVKDQAVVIKDIKLNGMLFPYITTHGVFTTDRGEKLKTDYLGHNGVYTFNFGYPVETWIANHMYKQDM